MIDAGGRCISRQPFTNAGAVMIVITGTTTKRPISGNNAAGAIRSGTDRVATSMLRSVISMPRKAAPQHRRDHIARQFMHLARRRSEFLFRVMPDSGSPLHNILASSYLQGFSDASEAINHQAKTKAPKVLPWQC